MAKISRILIANRGEIAVRIARTCREMGIEVITLYTEAELGLPHIEIGDEAINLGEGPLSETYLNQSLLLDIAKTYKCDAIHPGYGFLSENAGFRKKVQDAGLIFIGPRPKAMEIMGDKVASKIAMEKIGVPLIPGYHGDNQDADFLQGEADKIGYPVMIKASAGGGGKGMRIVRSKEEFQEALGLAKSEALKSFSDDRVLIEKFIERPRHIEIQVFGDLHENYVYLFERECSVQRRHQKVVEEAPAVCVDETLRAKMGQTAVDICKGIDYVGAGTIEYMLDEDGSYYFLEMNTRLQVEHPVSELITGQDFVRWQILVASGEELPKKQKDLKIQGWSIEVRLYAEDPDNNYMPTMGTLTDFTLPQMPGVRLDTGFTSGSEVSVNFDPMLGKLIVHAEDRMSAIYKLATALSELSIQGFKTNREFLYRILMHPEYQKGNVTTHFLNQYKEDLRLDELSDHQLAQIIACYHFRPRTGSSAGEKRKAYDPWDSLGGFRSLR